MRAPIATATMVDPYSAIASILAAPELEPVSASESDAALAASSTPESLLPEYSSDASSLSTLRSSEPLEPLSESPTSTSVVLELALELDTLLTLNPVEFGSDDDSLALPETLDPAEDADADVDPDIASDADAEREAAVSAEDTVAMARTSRSGVRNFILELNR